MYWKRLVGIVAVLCLVMAFQASAQNLSKWTHKWQVNGNGYTGLLVYNVNPQTMRVNGLLLGTPVEGYKVGRHLVLHRYPQGKSQIWDGWEMDSRLGAPSLSSYSKQPFLAGTISEHKAGDSLSPWYAVPLSVQAPWKVSSGSPGGSQGGGTGSGGGSSTGSGTGGQARLDLSCKDNENVEKGCCCFKGAHTYLFAPRRVAFVDAQVDTGRGRGCKSTVRYEAKVGQTWFKLKEVNAVSSIGNKETYRFKVRVPVNRVISGFRIADGCKCCIDYSRILVY